MCPGKPGQTAVPWTFFSVAVAEKVRDLWSYQAVFQNAGPLCDGFRRQREFLVSEMGVHYLKRIVYLYM